MSDTGLLLPTSTGYDIYGIAPGAANDWTNPSYAFTDDTNYATESNAGADQYQSYGGFSFGVPTGATIDGIEAQLYGRRGAAAGVQVQLRLLDSTSAYRTLLTANLTTSDALYTAGGSGSLFSGTWVANDFPDGQLNFFLYYAASTETAYVDYIKLRVFYTVTTYTLTYRTRGQGYLTGSVSQTVNAGADGTAVTAVPFPTYSFSRWSDGSTDNPRTDTSVSANLDVTAEYTSDWSNTSKNNASPSNISKNNASPSNVSKNNGSWTNVNKT